MHLISRRGGEGVSIVPSRYCDVATGWTDRSSNPGGGSFFYPQTLLGGPEYLSRYSDSLRAGRPGDQISVGARFSPHVQTGPGAHPASYTTGTGFFPGLKRPGCGVDQMLKKE
jgi:hypothetical protein